MARSFDGSADYLEATTSPVTSFGTSGVTLAGWFYPNNTTSVVTILQVATNGGNGRLQLYADGTASDLIKAESVNSAGTGAPATAGTFTASTWQHAAGVFASTTSRTAYFNGTAGTVNTTDSDPSISGFNRTLVAARRNSAGVGAFGNTRVAECGIWNVGLSNGEIAMLAAGYSPLMVRPLSLVFYAPLHGRNGAAGNEEAWVGNATLVQTSSPALVDHPRIIYPRRRSDIWVPAAAATAPTITALSARLITATSAQPRISYS